VLIVLIASLQGNVAREVIKATKASPALMAILVFKVCLDLWASKAQRVIR